MPRDHYDVLGVSSGEPTKGVCSAHRDLARRYHPERAGRHGTRRYREAQRAFGVLSDGAARAAYDRRPQPAGASSPPPQLSLRRDYQDGQPPLAQVLESIRRDFTADLPKSGRVDTLELRVYAADTTLELGVPVYHPCPTCHGTGAVMTVACKACDGSGALEDEERVAVTSPRVSLRSIGIHSIELRLLRVS